MTEIEELSEESFAQTEHQNPPECFDQDGQCHHQHVFDDQREQHLRRCACSEVRYYICQFCSTVINLARSNIVWPHCCVECARPACVPCANEMRRADKNRSSIICAKCDTTPDARQRWIVMYRSTLLDRDKRPHVSIRPHPVLFSDRDSAAIAALQYFPVVIPSVISQEALEPFAQAMKKTFKGWMNAPELRSGYEILKAEVGLFPLHEVGTELLRPPSGPARN